MFEENGLVEFEEFEKMLEKKGMRELDAQEELMAAFKVFDTDGNGYINVDEFKYAMTNLGEKFSDEDIEDMINKFDIDKDGRLNYSGKSMGDHIEP